MSVDYKLITGNSELELKEIQENSMDSVITDPPYGIGMASWDKKLPPKIIWEECFKVLKPGSFLLAFSSPRNYHRLASDIEDSGFEIVDQIFWLTTTKLSKRNALKPVSEPICVAQKKRQGTIEENFNIWGTGIVNRDSCRVPWEKELPSWTRGGYERIAFRDKNKRTTSSPHSESFVDAHPEGRNPTNVIGQTSPLHQQFFFNPEWTPDDNDYLLYYFSGRAIGEELGKDNDHPTPKPLELMRYLIKLFSPKGGLVLDPFSGSGTTGIAALKEGRNYLGIEKESSYNKISEGRFKKLLQSSLIENIFS